MTDGNESREKPAPGETVSGPGAPRSEGSSLLPESIGGYRILGKLGEGGMGIVFLAEQPSPRREVAVKVIRGGRLVGDHQIHLFRREAESLARLKHPGIAAIYEAGLTEDGSHFFAMELVRGEALEERIERGPWPLPKDEVVRRLRLFLEICDAVHYAHQRGVIHRDLKPGNVIVNEEGSIKILDFGLARITDPDAEATATALGTIRGTLAYMSPEQARGDPAEIDLRTDVYSLGVILYEALSGARPIEIETKSLVDALRKISEDRPRPLREVWMGAARLDPDLDTIIGKAIEKEPDRRYASAAALAEDVERYLTSQPIQARPPSAWYQARKFAARNRVLVAGAVATALALVGGAVVSTVFGLREAAQRREAERARADVETVADFQARMLSGVNPEATGVGIARAAREVLGSALTSRGRAEEEIDAALASLDAALRDVSTTDVARRILHENVLAPAAEAAAAEFGGRPALEARLLETIARTYRGLGMATEAESHARRALALRRETGGESDRATLEASRLLGNSLAEIGRFDEAGAILEPVLERLRETGGPEDPATLEAAHEVALLEWRRGRYERAEAMLSETLEAQTRLLGRENESTINTANTRAGVLFRLGRYDEAERLWTDVVERRREIFGPDNPQTLGAISNLALARMTLGRLEEADALFRDAHRSYVRTLGEAHPTTVSVLFNRAIVAQRRDRPDEAEGLYREALSVRERLRGPDHPETLSARNDLGVFLTAAGRFEEAREVLTNLVRRAERALGRDSADRAQYVHSYAELLLTTNEFAEAEARLAEAIDVYERVGSRYLGLALHQAAALAARRGDRASSLSRLRAAVEAGHARDGILDDPAFARYRGDPEFAALLIPSSSKSASR